MARPFDGIVLLAHGARDARWMKPFFRIRGELEARMAPLKVALAFMEFTSPTFEEAVGELRETGARRVLVVPLFLSGGGHVARDIPAAVAPERARHPRIDIVVSGAIGEQPEVVGAMRDAVERLAKG